jgi:hypothetical protein
MRRFRVAVPGDAKGREISEAPLIASFPAMPWVKAWASAAYADDRLCCWWADQWLDIECIAGPERARE